jgi:hypothetical protein
VGTTPFKRSIAGFYLKAMALCVRCGMGYINCIKGKQFQTLAVDNE